MTHTGGLLYTWHIWGIIRASKGNQTSLYLSELYVVSWCPPTPFYSGPLLQSSSHFHTGPCQWKGLTITVIMLTWQVPAFSMWTYPFRQWEKHFTEFNSWFYWQINSVTIAILALVFLSAKWAVSQFLKSHPALYPPRPCIFVALYVTISIKGKVPKLPQFFQLCELKVSGHSLSL